MVFARFCQGLCGAALVPMSQAVLLDINPVARHSRAMAIWMTGVTVGPILGPALGGWLTESYNWRWVFYINLPFGVLAFLGILGSMRETTLQKTTFDWFGFVALSLAVGALQLMLDRGQLNDWFNSAKICMTALVAGICGYLFIVHMLTATRVPFMSAGVFKDRNFTTGSFFVFLVGAVLYATLALLPPLLQGLLNYPVTLTGFVTVPRGVGTLVAMFIVGRLTARVDVRLIIAVGFCLAAISLWQMTGFYLQMDTATVIWSGVSQGLGMGLVYVPLASITFATLAPQFRNEATALFSLARNIGSSIGISAMEALQTRKYPDDACASGGAHYALHRVAAFPCSITKPECIRPEGTERERNEAGGDDCIQQWLQIDDGTHPVLHTVGRHTAQQASRSREKCGAGGDGVIRLTAAGRWWRYEGPFPRSVLALVSFRAAL
jgi:DHA2 family multidrug resistance protein